MSEVQQIESTVEADAGKVKAYILAHAIWVAALAGVAVGWLLHGKL